MKKARSENNIELQTQIMMRSIGKKAYGSASGKLKNVMRNTDDDPWFRDYLTRYEDSLCCIEDRQGLNFL